MWQSSKLLVNFDGSDPVLVLHFRVFTAFCHTKCVGYITQF